MASVREKQDVAEGTEFCFHVLNKLITLTVVDICAQCLVASLRAEVLDYIFQWMQKCPSLLAKLSKAIIIITFIIIKVAKLGKIK